MTKEKFNSILNEWFSDLAGSSIWDEGTTAEQYENLKEMRGFLESRREAHPVRDVDPLPGMLFIQKAVAE